MKKSAKTAVVLLAAFLVAGAVWAAQPVSESFPLGPGAEVEVELLSGGQIKRFPVNPVRLRFRSQEFRHPCAPGRHDLQS